MKSNDKFGVLLKTKGYGVLWALAMSVCIYAGSMQYVAIDLLAGGASLVVAALTTLTVNARHLFYGISMLDKYKGTGLKKLYLIFGMCDESFSINYTAEIPEDVDKGWFMMWVTVLNQFYWVLGSTLGGIFGSFIHFNTEGLDFVMTALFVVIFLEQWMKENYRTTDTKIKLGIRVAKKEKELLEQLLPFSDNLSLVAHSGLLSVISHGSFCD